jgi:GH18 family chitinase
MHESPYFVMAAFISPPLRPPFPWPFRRQVNLTLMAGNASAQRNGQTLVAMLAIAGLVASCRKADTPGPTPPGPTPVTIAPPPDLGFYVVGYMPSYRDPDAVPDQKFRMCNVVNYAFAAVGASGDIAIANPGRLTTVADKARRNGAKVMLSINGTTANWAQMAATAAGRNYFIRQVMTAVRANNLNGVDIDWEFPSTADGTSTTFTALMKELGDSCHLNAKYYLSAAITAGKYPGSIRDAISTELLQGDKVDFYNIMAYDDFSTTAAYRHHSDINLAQTSLNYWINTRGMPRKRAVLGLPAYGRPSGITQTGTTLAYAAILGQGGSPRSDSATVSVTGFTAYTIYYNGQPTIKNKAMLAKNLANGIMLWEKGQDSHDATSLLRAACDTLGRSY